MKEMSIKELIKEAAKMFVNHKICLKELLLILIISGK